jgi:SulP family sulfate permease
MKIHPGLAGWFPILQWGPTYDRQALARDGVAALIVTLMLVPQSLAYAALAGLPPQAGLYASIAPLVLYAVFGSSRVLAVGPVAVVSLMTADVIRQQAALAPIDPATLAVTLAFLSGVLLLAMGALRLGFLASFLSHPVIAGFITASALLISVGQLPVMVGLPAGGTHFFGQLTHLVTHLPQAHALTAALGLGTLAALFWARRGLRPALVRCGLGLKAADIAARAAPVVVIAAAAALTAGLHGPDQGVGVVGQVPSGAPPLSWPSWDLSLWAQLALPAFLISLVGFVESVSVGQTLAARRRQRIEPDRELVALGASNVGAALTGGFPVTGGFARSVVNFDAGAQTPAAGVFTALGILAVTLWLTPALHFVPKAALAATIVVAVMSLVDLNAFRHTWAYSRADFTAMAATVGMTLVQGVEAGLVTGVALSLGLFVYRTSRPHIAEVGQVPGTEHFRNVQRHAVHTHDHLLGLRMDESLYFANARALEDRINAEVARRPALAHVVLQCSAINDIDASALESLEAIDARLREAGITLHLSEVKGPVMDRLRDTAFLRQLRGQVFLTHHQAVQALAPAV